MSDLPFWAEAASAALLALSGVLVVISAIGFVRLPDFFQRMHPPALAYTLGNWTVALAAILTRHEQAALHVVLIPILLAMTVPVTTVLLARVALFRSRAVGAADVPPPVTAPPSIGGLGRAER